MLSHVLVLALSVSSVLAVDSFSSPNLERRQTLSCGAGRVSCGANNCMPVGYTCCSGGSYCLPTQTCEVGSNGQQGCCLRGSTCTGPGGILSIGSTITGSGTVSTSRSTTTSISTSSSNSTRATTLTSTSSSNSTRTSTTSSTTRPATSGTPIASTNGTRPATSTSSTRPATSTSARPSAFTGAGVAQVAQYGAAAAAAALGYAAALVL